MEYKYLGNTQLKVSSFGFGCVQLGMHQWGDVSEKELGKALQTAFENGVTFFDTADVYGLGKSEENLQKYLGKNLNNVVISSKFGVRILDGKTVYDNSPSWIRQAVEDSLNRLKRDYIDLYQVHYWDEKTSFDTITECLEKLIEEGKIRYYGVSNISSNVLKDNIKYPNFASFSFQYSLANRANEPKIKEMKEQGLSFLSWGSLGEGILSGKYRSLPSFSENDRRHREIYQNFHGQNFQKNMLIVNELERVSTFYENKTIPQVAIRWILDYLDTEVVLVGVKTEQQLLDNLEAFNWKLQLEHIHSLENISI